VIFSLLETAAEADNVEELWILEINRKPRSMIFRG